jgi:hypothetical protein
MNNLGKHFLCGTDKNLHSGRLCGAIGLMTSAVKVALARTVVKALGKGIALGPPALDREVAETAAQIMGRKEMAALGLAEPGRAKD